MSPNRRLSLVTDDEPLEPVDPDYALIGSYLDKSLTMREAAAFERRLVEDAEFFEKAWPVILIWDLPRHVRARNERARARAKGLVRHPPPQAPEPTLVQAPPVLPEPLEDFHRSRRLLSTLTTGAHKMLKTAGIILMVFSGSSLFWTRYFTVPRPPIATYPDRAPRNDIPKQSVQIETSVGESKEIPLRGGSHLLLRPNSRLTFGYLSMPGMKGLTAALDGEMAIELTKEDFVLDLRTSSGRAMFTPGIYAVRCEAGCTAMLLTVGLGSVRMRGDSASMTLTAGEKGMVPKHRAPEKVTPGDGWPELQPARVP